MITATTDELNWSRSWIGQTEEEDTFNERFDRYYRTDSEVWSDQTSKRAQALYDAIEESLRSQLAVLIQDQPSSMSADGNSLSYAHNISSLTKQLEKFQALYGSARMGVKKFHRRIGR